jgi:hypothetical protein
VAGAGYSGAAESRIVFHLLEVARSVGRECELLGSDGGAHGLHLLAVGGRPTAGPSGLLGGGGVAHFVLLAAVSGRFLRAGNLR